MTDPKRAAVIGRWATVRAEDCGGDVIINAKDARREGIQHDTNLVMGEFDGVTARVFIPKQQDDEASFLRIHRREHGDNSAAEYHKKTDGILHVSRGGECRFLTRWETFLFMLGVKP